MYIRCEYCGAVEDNLTNTCRNCGGLVRKYINITNANKLLPILHRKKLYFIIAAVFYCLVIIFSYYVRWNTQASTPDKHQGAFNKNAQSVVYKVSSDMVDEIASSVIAPTTTSDKPPELWSWIKDLNKSKDACLIKSYFILKSIKLENLIETEYGIYGAIKNNRVVVKCIEVSSISSKLLVAVAGNDKHSVELIRNIIIKEIN